MTLQSNSVKRDRSTASNRTDREALMAAFRDEDAPPAVSPGMRAAIEQICADVRNRGQGPERALVEFKLALADAANGVEIPLGPDRSKLLAGLVSTFIAELYEPATKSNTKGRALDCGDSAPAAP